MINMNSIVRIPVYFIAAAAFFFTQAENTQCKDASPLILEHDKGTSNSLTLYKPALKKDMPDFITKARGTLIEYSDKDTSESIEKRVKSIYEQGVNLVVIGAGGHHFMFNMHPSFDEYNRWAKEFTKIAHKYNIKVFEHHSVLLFINEQFRDQRKDWLQIELNPKEPLGKLNTWDLYNSNAFCTNNTDFDEYYYECVKKLIKETNVDGLLADDVGFLNGCVCKSCLAKFHAFTGYTYEDIKNNFDNNESEIWRVWIRFRMKSMGDFYEWLKARLDKDFGDFPLGNVTSSPINGFRSHKVGAYIGEALRGSDFIFGEAYHPVPFFSWRYVMSEGKTYQAIVEDWNSRLWNIYYTSTSKDPGATVPEEEDFNWSIGKLLNQQLIYTNYNLQGFRTDDPQRKYFLKEKNNMELFDPKIIETGNIALLYSIASRDAFYEKYLFDYMGACEIMSESMLPFRVITEHGLKTKDLSEFKTIIIPNAMMLSDDSIKTLKKFAGSGGHIIATYMTSMYDTNGKIKKNFTLSDIMGISFESTDKIDGNDAAKVKISGKAKTEVTVRQNEEEVPVVITNKYKNGKITYIASNIFNKSGQQEVQSGTKYKELRNFKNIDFIYKYILNPLKETAPFIVDCEKAKVAVNYFMTPDKKQIRIHLLNVSTSEIKDGDDLPEHPPIAYPPLRDIKIKFSGTGVKKATMSYPSDGSVKDLKIIKNEKNTIITIDELKDYAIISIE